MHELLHWKEYIILWEQIILVCKIWLTIQMWSITACWQLYIYVYHCLHQRHITVIYAIDGVPLSVYGL